MEKVAMQVEEKTKQRLLDELDELRQRLSKYEAAIADAGEGKRIAEQLRQERNRAQQYLDLAAVIMIALDRDGSIILLNRKGYEILGYPEGTLLGKDWFSTCLPNSVRARVSATFRQLMDGQLEPVECYENPVVTRLGEERIIAWHNTLLTDDSGRIVGTLSSGTDITGRRQAEEALQRAHDELEQRVKERTAELTAANEALQQSEEKYKTLVEALPDGVLMADLEGHILFASEQVRKMHGSDRVQDLLGREPLEFVAAEDHQRFHDNLVKTLNEGMTRNVQYLLLKRDGTCFAGEISAAVVSDRSGHPRVLVAIVRDVTERKQAQEALEREQRALQHMLHASDHERQLIAYDIHDGLAQQIAGALMQFEVFDRQKKSKPKQAANAFQAGMTMLHQSHFEARRLINGVRPPILDESGVVAAIAHLIHEPRGRKTPKIEFQSKVHFNRLESVEENAIYRIVQEGVTNACNHSKTKKVRVRLLQRGDRMRIEIRDWGTGFNPRMISEKQFGLTGIRERTRLLGGKCRIQSNPGSGTTIVVELPIVEKKMEE
jgi:PAS domain S-box-containing protein